MRVTSLKLPEGLDKRLSEMAARRGISRSALLREALAAFDREEFRSAASLARDLAGCVRGPRDLSTAARHLDGYGQ